MRAGRHIVEYPRAKIREKLAFAQITAAMAKGTLIFFTNQQYMDNHKKRHDARFPSIKRKGRLFKEKQRPSAIYVDEANNILPSTS